MLLNDLQHRLASLYEAPVSYDVYDFLITDAKLARILNGDGNNNERLLLHQAEDALDLSLFIDESILSTLRKSDPRTCLAHSNLDAFLIALEGVSHFNYVIWHAHHDRQITQLEMELQAEVDKFVTTLMLFDEQGTMANHDQVHRILFETSKFLPSDDTGSLRRYRDANRFAGQYCRKLQSRYPARHRQNTFINELRRFYRLGQNGKIRAIRQH